MIRVIFALCVWALFAGPASAETPSPVFGGVGIDGAPRADGSIVVKQLVLGGPAHLAGMRAGDIITRIDGVPTLGSNFKEMVEHRLRGRAGTEVLLRVSRPGTPKPMTLKLTRRQLAIAAPPRKEQPKGD